MIVEENKNIKCTTKDLRKFGITVGIVLALWGGLLFWRKREYYFYFLIFSGAFFFLGLFLPVLLKSIYKAWTALAKLLALFITDTILIILFYLVVTPIGLVTRLFGMDFLDLKRNENKDSYWIPKKITEFEKKSYENQF